MNLVKAYFLVRGQAGGDRCHHREPQLRVYSPPKVHQSGPHGWQRWGPSGRFRGFHPLPFPNAQQGRRRLPDEGGGGCRIF